MGLFSWGGVLSFEQTTDLTELSGEAPGVTDHVAEKTTFLLSDDVFGDQEQDYRIGIT